MSTTKRMWSVIWLHALLAMVVSGKTLRKQKVCVIGAGGAGLAMIKELASYPNDFEPIGFELNADIGGLWIYTDNGDLNEHGLPTRSAVYKNLRTNAPRVLMAFPDYQTFGGENRSCVKHETVLNYLHNYTEHFNFRSHIRFDTFVEKITRVEEDDWETTRWNIHAKDLNTDRSYVTTCDVVIIGNGGNFKPKIPVIPGIEGFRGQIIHSHGYRRPEDYANKTVVLLGAGTSGIDIAIDLSPYAKKIYLSHRHDKIEGKWPKNVIQVSGVVKAKGNQLELQNGSTIFGDSFIYCTGYMLDFPFLDESTDITFTDKYVEPLYEHMINAYHPTMMFLGLPTGYVITFSVYHIQAKYYAAFLRGKVQLPSLAERLKDAEIPEGEPRDHRLKEGQWAYYKRLADAGGFETLPDFYREGLAVWRINQQADWPHFKDNDMVLEDGKFVIKYPKRNA
ncbi:uncharacterized protein LOC131666600 [Phymastichus coffea]|uniref:uncharacterized protein LOC131666600 n=1 Tax=Phymastichus coffea TaxID=108790 RepID=UPI00273BE5A1|nr:uncharacterized protein LOC131666600 [Phymastichus coffea]